MCIRDSYDIVGHADLVKKFDRRASIDLNPYYRELLAEMKGTGVCFEVNTAGLRWPVGEIYPEPDFVRLGAELGVTVTLGSDSHCPEAVSYTHLRAHETRHDLVCRL